MDLELGPPRYRFLMADSDLARLQNNNHPYFLGREHELADLPAETRHWNYTNLLAGQAPHFETHSARRPGDIPGICWQH